MSDIEDVYPLIPFQQDLLARAKRARGGGVHQAVWELPESVDVDALDEAWQMLVVLSPVLRTTFGSTRYPLAQVVWTDVDSRVTVADWRHHASDRQVCMLHNLLARQRVAGFDFSAAPLARLAAIRCAADRAWLVWTGHRLIIDDWSLEQLRNDLVSLYLSMCRRPAESAVVRLPFRHFLSWLDRRDPRADHRYWADHLAGYVGMSKLGRLGPVRSNDVGRGRLRVRLTSTERARVVAFAKVNRLTVETMVEGALALALGVSAGSDDVAFAVRTSGRPPEVRDVEQIIGPLAVTVPRRVRLGDEPLVSWLTALQSARVEARLHEHAPLSEIRAAAAAPGAVSLDEVVLGFDHHWSATSGVEVATVWSMSDTGARLGLEVGTGEPFTITVVHESGSDRWARSVARDVRRALSAMAVDDANATSRGLLRVWP